MSDFKEGDNVWFAFEHDGYVTPQIGTVIMKSNETLSAFCVVDKKGWMVDWICDDNKHLFTKINKVNHE